MIQVCVSVELIQASHVQAWKLGRGEKISMLTYCTIEFHVVGASLSYYAFVYNIIHVGRETIQKVTKFTG